MLKDSPPGWIEPQRHKVSSFLKLLGQTGTDYTKYARYAKYTKFYDKIISSIPV
ncbi:hypothetical protein [Methanocella sp. MCL-LM]|uniref:hypothetical protein n=1 Tax=Methanocella sp. MCL-LM TaxID=3412035 RepID=UPI003C72A6FD